MRKDYWDACPEILRGYLGYMETVKGRSSKTVDEYFTDLRTFFRYLKRQRRLVDSNTADSEISIEDIDLDFVKSVTLNDVYDYLNYAKNESRQQQQNQSPQGFLPAHVFPLLDG